ncbi:MAG: xanthine dehydrogenase family protein molybdopterin-binding subunit, partial [Pseudomonadota bacterium]|nr:xanthine dehydrogenase family protein molybdopterin-binding subunit [Pseudomonadota bacterium]
MSQDSTMKDAKVTPLTPVGKATSRVDGPLKVSGTARYSSDFHFPGLLYAVPVGATVATGKVAAIDTSTADKMPGVRKIYTHENVGKLYPLPKSSQGMIDERRPPLDDTTVRYYGQYVALVVADTFEHATAAADSLKVTYTESGKSNVSMSLSADEKPSVDTTRGDPDKAFASAAVKVDQTYSTPTETHNPIELHASVAQWDGSHFTLYETTQAIMNYRTVMAQMLGVPADHVRVITEYLGSGFGGKLWPWSHALLAAMAARDLHKPIKLVVTREMMFHDVGHRPHTQQRMRLGAAADGQLVSLQQDFIHTRSRLGDYKEDCGEATGFLYSTDNLRVTAGFARRDIGVPTAMRGPGAVPGLFALESAMDELAIALKMDPVQLRLRNEPQIDEKENMPFSSRHFKECLTRGASEFGWDQRNPAIGSMRKDGTVLGWGVAGCTWIAERFPAEVAIQLNADGSVRVTSGTQDIGTGTYTVIAQMAAELTGVDISRVTVVIGDSSLPPGPLSGGSMATASMVPALSEATQNAVAQLLKAASAEDSHFAGVDVAQLEYGQGRVHRKGQSPSDGKPFGDVLASARMSHVEGKGKSEGTFNQKNKKFSSHSFGAHFVEITWQPDIARLRVSRVVSVIDAGRIINPLTGRNQIEGAVVMGVGMALFEETRYDHRNGK